MDAGSGTAPDRRGKVPTGAAARGNGRRDPFDGAEKLRKARERLVNDTRLSVDNRLKIVQFIDYCRAQGLGPLRTLHYLRILSSIGSLLGKPFGDATKQDMVSLLSSLEDRRYSEWTIHDHKVTLKKFYRWLRGGREAPEEVAWFSTTTRNHGAKLPEQMLTPDEVTRLAGAAENSRDRAFVQVLYETGCRIGEILSLNYGSVELDRYGAVILVPVKTGMRRVRVVASAQALASYLQDHPDKAPSSPLWVGLGTKNKNQPWAYPAARAMLVKLAGRVGLSKKVNPHSFRHSRASHLAPLLTEAQMNEYLGWRQGSEMPSIYVHMSGRDVDKALPKIGGVEVDEEEKKSEFKVRVCVRCGSSNSPASSFCGRCGLPLSAEGVAKVTAAEATASSIAAALAGRLQGFIEKELQSNPGLLREGKPPKDIFDALRLPDKILLSAVGNVGGAIIGEERPPSKPGSKNEGMKRQTEP